MRWWAGSLAAAATATLVYADTLTCGFVWDDVRAIRNNPDVLAGLRGDLWNTSLAGNDFWGDPMDHDSSHRSYRPLTVWTFRLDAYRGRVFSGDGHVSVSPLSFHQTNVALHAIASALVGWLCALLLSQTRAAGRSASFAKSMDDVAVPSAIAALLFAVHTIHTEAVAGLVGRADILSCTFFVLTVGVYEATRNVYAAAVLAALATLSKESGLTALGYCLILELLAWHGSKSLARISFLTAFAAVAVRARVALHQGKGLYKWTVLENHIALEDSLWSRACSYAHTHGLYLKLLFVPRGLSYHHGFGTVPLLHSPSILSLVAYGSLLLAGLITLVRRDGQLARFLAMGLLPFAPASNVLFPVGAVLAERLLYIPSVGACALIALVLERVRAISTRGFGLLLACCVVYGVLLSAWTLERNEDWKSDLALFEAGLREHPGNVGALNNVGYMYMQDEENRTRLALGRDLLVAATRAHPSFVSAWLNLGVAARKLGDHEEAVQALRALLALDPRNCQAKTTLADTLVQQLEASGVQQNTELHEAARAAVEDARQACPTVPLTPYAHGRLEALAAVQNNLAAEDARARGDRALEAFEEALRLSETLDVESSDRLSEGIVLDSMAVIARDRGDAAQALEYWERAQAARRVTAAVLSNAAVLGWVHAFRTFGGDNVKFTFSDGTQIGALQRAGQLLSRALDMEPDNGAIVANAGWLYEVAGDFKLALQTYERAATLAPEHTKILASVERLRALAA